MISLAAAAATAAPMVEEQPEVPPGVTHNIAAIAGWGTNKSAHIAKTCDAS